MEELKKVTILVNEKVTRHDDSRKNSLPPLRGRVGVGGNSQHKPRPCGCNTRKLVNNRFPALKGWGLGFSNSGTPQSLINVKHLLTYSPIHLFTRKRIAFTPAEVLITLAVIGVVAAMTIPTILNKYQEHIMIQKYKKVYSLLNNALLQQYADNGAYYECYYYGGVNHVLQSKDCRAMYENMKHILKTSKICDDNAYKNGCIPHYKGFDTIVKEQNLHPDDPDWVTKNFSGWTESQIESSSKQAWVLNDGTIIMFYLKDFGFKHIAVDLNGVQGPNKWGSDLFILNLQKVSNGAIVYKPAGGLIDKDGMRPEELHKKAGF